MALDLSFSLVAKQTLLSLRPSQTPLFSIDLQEFVAPPTELNQGPCPRFPHSYTSDGSLLFVFGGMNANEEPMNNLWMLDCDTWQWSLLSDASADDGGGGDRPLPRFSHSSWTKEGKVWILGGMSPSVDNSCFSFDLSLRTWSRFPVVSPSPDPLHHL